MNIQTNQMAKAMRHEEESNALLHHLINVANEQAEINQALQSDALGKLVAFQPVNSRRTFCMAGTSSPKDDVVNRGLLLCEDTIDRE